ncbi:uncharacterized protein LOC120282824 [Dioscorea cayenensis subsp. rotundata]|uniref:Uncharacterized protein LOC120282824 n=1 Tax=Dioscorea cayennensis subsp. rotundata TaxID=55577 RepID=A0AB40D4J2_DIOCR|nr:uncharacterized protein LOC120282824 [Dioscorea cayenensis subsp. rotundata]
MKQHLAGSKGNVDSCKRVPSDVQFLIQGSLKENVQKAKEKKGCFDELEGNDVEDTSCQVGKSSNCVSASPKGKRKASSGIESYFTHGIADPTQPSIKASLQSKEKWHDTDMSIAMWFYHACIPLNAINSPFFQVPISKIASMGHGYTGCTIIGDGWTDSRQRSLINFLVYSPKGISFIKSVDASGFITSAETLCNLFSEIIEIVGPKNVVHMVTDNGANSKAAERKITEKYVNIYWSACAAHSINLIMKDISEMPTIHSLAILASKITVFIYNHKWVLNWLRNQPNWTEIIRPGVTRFATTFIALKSLHDHRSHLQALVVSSNFKKFLNMQKGREVKQIILDENFWRNCLIMVKIMGPLIRLLRICDSDEKLAMGYVYDGKYRARKGIKELFKKKKHLYKPYTSIIKERWNSTLRTGIHVLAYWLNQAFLFDEHNLCQKLEVQRGILDVIEQQTMFKPTELMEEMKIFRERQKTFVRPLALNTLLLLMNDGNSLVVMFLICKSWQLGFLVKLFLLLGENAIGVLGSKDRSCDPIDYECIDKTEFWVVEEEPEGELDYDELESMVEEQPRMDEESTNLSKGGNEDDTVVIEDDDNTMVGVQGMTTNELDEENWLA